MKTSMDLKALLEEVIRQDEPARATYSGSLAAVSSETPLVKPKRDFTTSTEHNVRMTLEIDGLGESHTIYIVMQKPGSSTDFERFGVSYNAHQQISAKLSIPWKYYQRLLSDHPDMIVDQVNALFEREPAARLFRVLDGKVRAFLSNKYLRLDNKEILKDILPTITAGTRDGTLRVMTNHVDPDNMHMKVIFLDDSLSHEVASVRGQPRIIRPGFKLSNSETGRGALRMDAFFYDSYCTNGCVFGVENAFSMQRRHLGSRLIEGECFEVLSNETKALEDKAIISAVNDGLKALSDPGKVAEMANRLIEAHNSEKATRPVAAVELVVKELDLNEGEKDGILETFLRDLDFSQFGMASAVTELANRESTSYGRACDLEEIGGKILSMGNRQWSQFAQAVPVAKAA